MQIPSAADHDHPRRAIPANLAEILRDELAKKNYVCKPINIGSNTDPYQPIEKTWRLTRAGLELLSECHHPCTIVTQECVDRARYRHSCIHGTA